MQHTDNKIKQAAGRFESSPMARGLPEGVAAGSTKSSGHFDRLAHRASPSGNADQVSPRPSSTSRRRGPAHTSSPVAVRACALAPERVPDVVDHRQIWLLAVDRSVDAPLVFVQIVNGVDESAGPFQAIPSRQLLQVVFTERLDAEPPG